MREARGDRALAILGRHVDEGGVEVREELPQHHAVQLLVEPARRRERRADLGRVAGVRDLGGRIAARRGGRVGPCLDRPRASRALEQQQAGRSRERHRSPSDVAHLGNVRAIGCGRNSPRSGDQTSAPVGRLTRRRRTVTALRWRAAPSPAQPAARADDARGRRRPRRGSSRGRPSLRTPRSRPRSPPARARRAGDRVDSE